MSGVRPWIGVDFDDTLRMPDGSPCDVMVKCVRQWLNKDIEVRIVTARLNDVDYDAQERMRSIVYVRDWCRVHIGADLLVQWGKSRGMIALYDDKVVRVDETGPCAACDHEARKVAEERTDAYTRS